MCGEVVDRRLRYDELLAVLGKVQNDLQVLRARLNDLLIKIIQASSAVTQLVTTAEMCMKMGLARPRVSIRVPIEVQKSVESAIKKVELASQLIKEVEKEVGNVELRSRMILSAIYEVTG